MSNIFDSITRQRALLDYPRLNRPSLHVFYWETIDSFQELYNRLANTNESFAQDEKLLTVSPGADVFTVAQDSRFGKVLLVTTYSTADTAIERSINFVNDQNAYLDNWQPNNYQGSWFQFLSGGYHTAEKMAFFYQGNTLKVRVRPRPQAAATYKVKYSIGDWSSNANLQSTPILSQFHRLFEIRSALACLPYCEWDGIEKDERKEKINELKESLMNKEQRYEEDFSRHIKTITKPKIIRRKAWNEF